MSDSGTSAGKWAAILSAPILSLVAFVVSYYLDPLNFAGHQAVAAIPAFLLSIIILLIGHLINSTHELHQTSIHSDRIYEAIKDYLHVTKVGSPEKAQSYINSRLPAVREAQNTSFNLEDESERANEKFYETDTYDETLKQVTYHACRNLIWKDIGDALALPRLRAFQRAANELSKSKRHGYRFRLIAHQEPQINFIILEYLDGEREVLFNWDFRGIGQDPTVLISRDKQIVDMFSIHFAQLWRRSSEDHDNHPTKSTSTK
ncbi:hypothetical protein [Rhodopseudomonas palustris]